jgi:chaperonin GroEL (HSP60 family)
MLNDFWHSSTAKCINIFSSSFQSESYLVAGTTCATVLTQAILTEGCKSIAVGVNVMDLRRGINMAVDAVISDLKRKASMLSTPEEIKQVMDF